MVLPSTRYDQARRDATFHVQVELNEISSTADTPGEISVCAKVVQIFRARKPLRRGEAVKFGVAVNRPGDELPAGGTLWIDYDNLASHCFLEVFLNGDPPNCTVALWQYQLIDSPSKEPTMGASKDPYTDD
jgi:hypothetical protein